MISRRRLWADALGQAVLLAALPFLLLPQPNHYGLALTILLALWQMASALHLWMAYRYVQRRNFARVAVVVFVGALLWSRWVGAWAYLPVLGLLSWYFAQTVRDGIRVARRPRSFWNLR